MKYYFIPLFILLSACGKMPLHKAGNTQSWPITEVPGQYDRNSKMMYETHQDAENVYLHLSTTERINIIKILRFGFAVYVDETGKKKEDKGFIYPRRSERTKGGKGSGSGSGREQGPRNGTGDPNDMLNRLLKHTKESSKELVEMGFEGKGSRKIYNLDLEQPNVLIDFEVDSLNRLHYYASIPKEKIFTDEKYNDGILSIGLVSGAMQMPTSPGGGAGGGMRPGAGGGGGRPGGGMGPGGGMRPGSGQGGGMDMEQRMKMMEPIEVWFKVELE